MSISNSRQSYQDCYEVFDRAIADDRGCRVKLPSYDKATFFRMRLHQARKLDRQDKSLIYPLGHPMHAASPYDPLVVRIRREKDDFYVYVEQIGAELGEIELLSEIYEAEPLLLAQEEQKYLEHQPAEALITEAEPALVIEQLRRRV